jgi:NAD(P)H dehydrogenase (quinone)
MEEHFATEDLIKQSGLNYIIFQNALYMEVLLYYVGKTVFEGGAFSQVTGDGKVAFTLRKDQSEAMANVLLNEAFNNQTYRFTASATYSMYDVAETLSELAGRKITYCPVEVPKYKALMKKQGLPEVVVDKIVNFNVDIKNNQESTVTNDLEIKLGRKPTTLKEGLKILFNL